MRNLTLMIAVLTFLTAGCTEQLPPRQTPSGTPERQLPPSAQPEAETSSGLASELPLQTQAVVYKVIKIIDGDTIDVLTDDKQTIRLRLNGIDTPERGQPFGNNAKQFLSDTIGGKSVRLVTHDTDRYGRTIADVYLPVQDELVNLPDMFLNRELVKRGLAWHYKEYSDDERLAEDERRARLQKLGLWGGSHQPIAPWDWRKLSKEERDAHR